MAINVSHSYKQRLPKQAVIHIKITPGSSPEPEDGEFRLQHQSASSAAAPICQGRAWSHLSHFFMDSYFICISFYLSQK